jgi:hypothetical protein
MGRWVWRSALVLAGAAAVLAGCAAVGGRREGSGGRTLGWQVPLGNGTVASYAEVDRQGAPAAVGIVLSRAALEGLPPTGSDQHHCFDRNRDGTVDPATECVETYEFVVPLPDAVARRADIPFKWVLLNWNPVGHIPPGVYDVPHFDVHFYMEPIANVFAITAGPCGPELVRCDQFQTAKKPVPANYVPADFRDVDAVVPAMGNHLIDLSGPEFQKQPFTHSWIYGAYDGRVIFGEVMLTRAFLLSRPSTCVPIKAAAAVAVGGFYPTVYCVRHEAPTGAYTVSLERFVRREASAPAPNAAKP